ncbi:hypothetical protein ACTOJ1_001704 [Shigella flexneri]
MNNNINEMAHSVEGLSIFIKKRVDAIVFKNNINIRSRWNLLKNLRKKGVEDLNLYYGCLYFIIGVPLINFIISILAFSTFTNMLEDFGLLLSAIALSFISVFVITYLFRDDIKHYIDLTVLKEIDLSKDDVMEVGLYLTQRDKDILVNKINQNNKVSLKDIQNLLAEKELYYEKAKDDLVKLNKEKEKNELTRSINLLK